MGGHTKASPASWPRALWLSTVCTAPSSCLAPRAPLKTRLVLNDALRFLGSRSDQESQARCLAWSGVTAPAAATPAQGKPLRTPLLAHSAPRVLETAWPSSAHGLRLSSTSVGTPHKANPRVHAPNLHLRRCRVRSAGVSCPGWGNQHQNGRAVIKQTGRPSTASQQYQRTPFTK